MKDNNNFIFKIKPNFNKKIIFLRLLPFYLFTSLWIGMFIGITSNVLLNGFYLKPLHIGILFGIIAFILCSIVSLMYYKNIYSKTEYLIFKDRIEYSENFLNVDMKTIWFKNITEVNLKINVFQNKNELGNILLGTQNNTRKNSYKKYNGLYIKDISNSILIYKKISDLMF